MLIPSDMQFRLLCIYYFLLLTSSLFAQIGDLIENPDIVWIAEFTTDHRFDPDAPPYSEITKILQFKSDTNSFELGNPRIFLPQKLFIAGVNNQFPCYADSSFSRQLSQKELDQLISTTDTVITFDPDSYTETIRIVRSDKDMNKISRVRVHQIIYFNQQSKQFNTSILALAPLFLETEESYSSPLFWVKMNSRFPDTFQASHQDIHFGVLSFSFEHPLQLANIKVIKNQHFNFGEKLYQQAVGLQQLIERDIGFGSGKYLKKSQVEEIYSGKDTITIFDPNTFEKSVKVVEHQIKYEEIDRFRLVQEWYFDGKKNILFNQLKAIAPIHPIREKDKAKLYRALYYIRYNSEKLKKS